MTLLRNMVELVVTEQQLLDTVMEHQREACAEVCARMKQIEQTVHALSILHGEPHSGQGLVETQSEELEDSLQRLAAVHPPAAASLPEHLSEQQLTDMAQRVAKKKQLLDAALEDHRLEFAEVLARMTDLEKDLRVCINVEPPSFH
jgi:dihydroorotate dehydrogenase